MALMINSSEAICVAVRIDPLGAYILQGSTPSCKLHMASGAHGCSLTFAGAVHTLHLSTTHGRIFVRKRICVICQCALTLCACCCVC